MRLMTAYINSSATHMKGSHRTYFHNQMPYWLVMGRTQNLSRIQNSSIICR